MTQEEQGVMEEFLKAVRAVSIGGRDGYRPVGESHQHDKMVGKGIFGR